MGGDEMMFDSKSFLASSTIWLNAVGIIVIVLQIVTSTSLVVDPEIQALLLAILNLLNRFRTTKRITV